MAPDFSWSLLLAAKSGTVFARSAARPTNSWKLERIFRRITWLFSHATFACVASTSLEFLNRKGDVARFYDAIFHVEEIAQLFGKVRNNFLPCEDLATG